jgi:aspartyl-tRNA(Asn)/glutamyl-tRNA(Gln) amidotransferase subunit A
MYQSFTAIQADLKQAKTSCEALVNNYLANIQNKKHLNAFVEVWADEALQAAKIVDAKIKNNTAGKLAGAVIAIKDVLCYKNHSVTCSSKILGGFESLYTATAVQKLLDEDAIIIGRTNCDEFAMGSSNENSFYGNVLNDLDNSKVPGGSSGGSAVAVQANLCLASLGTDTGGSIRQPASFCGIVGVKPSYGRISRYGLVAYASSFDQIGVFTKSVEDAALLLEIMSGADKNDSTCSQKNVADYLQNISNTDVSKLKIAYLPSTIETKGLDTEIKNRTFEILEQLKAKGATVEAATFDKLDYLVPTYYVLTTAEASSNLARFDGVRFGFRSPNATDLESVYKKTRAEGFGKEVKRRIMLGTFVLSEGFYDAYYTKAQKVRRAVTNEINDLFNNYDFIVCPTTPTTAFQFNSKKDPIEMYLNDIYTVLANIAGIPGISIPLGLHSNGMPFGFQIMSKKFSEEQLLSFSNWCMKNISTNLNN